MSYLIEVVYFNFLSQWWALKFLTFCVRSRCIHSSCQLCIRSAYNIFSWYGKELTLGCIILLDILYTAFIGSGTYISENITRLAILGLETRAHSRCSAARTIPAAGCADICALCHTPCTHKARARPLIIADCISVDLKVYSVCAAQLGLQIANYDCAAGAQTAQEAEMWYGLCNYIWSEKLTQKIINEAALIAFVTAVLMPKRCFIVLVGICIN